MRRGHARRTDMYSGVDQIRSNGSRLELFWLDWSVTVLPLYDVAEILLDDDPGGGL